MYICNDCGSINLDDFSDCIHCDNRVTYIQNTVLRNVVDKLGVKSENKRPNIKAIINDLNSGVYPKESIYTDDFIKSEADVLKEVLISIYERGCVNYSFIKRVILTHPRLTDDILLNKFNMKR